MSGSRKPALVVVGGEDGFAPRLAPDDHRSFFSAAEGWGRFVQRRDGGVQVNRLEVAAGFVEIVEARFGLAEGTTRVRAVATLGARTPKASTRVPQ